MPWQHTVELRGIGLANIDRFLEGRFGLMFKRRPAFRPPDELLTGLAAAMVEPQPPPQQLDNPRIPAGFTFLGQFLDHDMTFDTTPLDEQQADPNALTNFRSARFDLDSVYGMGPTESPELYDPNDRAKLLITGLGDPNQPDDLPRRADGKAIIGEPRNDENLIVCQLHIAFMKFHNALVDHVRTQGGVRPDAVFEEARGLCRWHYQWMVVHDFLPRVVGQQVVNQKLEEREGQPAKVKLDHYKPQNPNKPMMPVEFAAAAYRFGHSMIRAGYAINAQGGGAAIFGEPATEFNLNGSRPIPLRLVIAWRHFFDLPGVPGPPTNPSRRIDTDLSLSLFTLPPSVVAPPDPRVSLAERNLLRGKKLGLPSGQEVAREMDLRVLSNQELGLGPEPGWQGEAPLWFYVLKEAELLENSERLGPVGATIVAEVFLGLLERDRNSYLRRDARFRPAPPIAPRGVGQFAMGDLLKFAGVT